MSEHRYPCPADPGELLLGVQAVEGHRHACKHDAVALSSLAPEHECACGMTWVDRRETMRVYSNVPPDDQAFPLRYGYPKDDPYPEGVFAGLAWHWRNRKRART